MMNKFRISVTREQWLAVAKIVLAALLAIAAVFGYDLGVIQPREQSLQISSALSGIATRAAGGVTRFTSNLWLQNSGMTIDKTLDVTGVSTLSGGVVGDVTGNLTGNVTGNISGDVSSAVVTATTRITTPLITVNGAATVGSLSTAGDVSARAVTATGQITGASLTVNGAASVGGAATVGSLSSAGDVSVRAVTATGQITGASLTVNGASSVGSLSTSGDVSARNVTATGGISVATVSTFNQAVNAYGGIDTNGTSVVLDGDGHSWITAPTQDQLMMVTGSGERVLVTDAGTLVTGTLGVSDVATVGALSTSGGVTSTGHITTNKLYIGGASVSPVVLFGGAGVYSNVPISHGLSTTPSYIGGCTAVTAGAAFTYTIAISDYDSYSAWITFYDPVANVEVTDVGVQISCFASP